MWTPLAALYSAIGLSGARAPSPACMDVVMLPLSKKPQVHVFVWPHTATERYLRDGSVPLLLVSRLSSRALQPPTKSTHTTSLGHSQLLLVAPVYSVESTLNLVPLKIEIDRRFTIKLAVPCMLAHTSIIRPRSVEPALEDLKHL